MGFLQIGSFKHSVANTRKKVLPAEEQGTVSLYPLAGVAMPAWELSATKSCMLGGFEDSRKAAS